MSDLDAPRFESSLSRQPRHSPQQFVLTAQSDPLRCGRGVQLELRRAVALQAGAPDGRLDGVEHGGCEEEWRLAHSFTGVNSPGVAHAAQQTNIELGWNIVETGNFVSSRTCQPAVKSSGEKRKIPTISPLVSRDPVGE